MKIKLIIIDLYGMISRGSYKQTSRWIANKLKLNADDVYKVVYNQYFTPSVNKKISEREMFSGIVKYFKLKVSWEKLKTIHRSYQVINTSVFNFCLNLQKREKIIVLLSKNTPGEMSYTVKKLKLKPKFKNIINTYDIGLSKASPEILKFIAKKFKVNLKEILFCDDQGFNLVAAKKLGIKTILYKNFKQFQKQIKKWAE